MGGKKKQWEPKNFLNLPNNAKKYISFIENFINIPITMLSTSPKERIQFYSESIFLSFFGLQKLI